MPCDPNCPAAQPSGTCICDEIDQLFSGVPLPTVMDNDLPYMDPPCQCGSDKVGSTNHSTWCPKHAKA